MTKEIETMPGVVGVTVKRAGNTFEVLVVMENMEFEPFSAVAQKKVDLYEGYPDYTFNFNFITAASLQRQPDDMLATHAA